MKLSKIQISNFKSIKELTIDFPDSGILILVGENNAGKSNIIRAIDAICGDSWYGREKLEDHDYYLRNKENQIQINLFFDNGKFVNFSPTPNDWGIKYFLDWDGRQKVPFGSPSIKEDFPSTYLGADRTFDKHLSFYDWTLIGRIRKAFHKRITEELKAEIEQGFETVIKSFHKVPGFTNFIDDFSKQFKLLMPSGKGHMQIDFKPFTPANYFKTMQILAFDPNQSDKPIDVDELGEGARNMILIALLRSYAQNFKNGGLNGILALEEPELFLHPQARRHLSRVLRELAETGIQVIISTHSDSFIDTEYFDSIGRVVKIPDLENKGKESTSLIQVSKKMLVDYAIKTGVPDKKVSIENIQSFYKTTSNHRLNEGFFARCLILVEGETEELALQEYLKVLGIDCDAFGISIIEVKGKNQIPKYWRLYSAFQIPIIVIFDNDNSEEKQSSNRNLANCFGLSIEEIINNIENFKHIKVRNELLETDILILENDFETAVQNDLIKKGYDGLYQALESQAREVIKPLKNQQKGAIAREIARNIQDQIGDYVPDFVKVLAETISKKINFN